MNTERFLRAGALAVAVLLTGCAVSPSVGPRYVERHEYYEPVRMAPPAPYIEHVGYPPVVGHVWISGYWNWGGARYAWVPGRWEAPRSGHHWVPHRWEKNGDHWRQQGGHWERGGNAQRTAVDIRQPEHDTHRQASVAASAPALRHSGREAPRGDDQRGRSSVNVQPMPERSVRLTPPLESRGLPRIDASRPAARSEEHSPSERQRRPEAAVREGNRDAGRSDARERSRGGERNREESREESRDGSRDGSRERNRPRGV
ncbi:MAG: hypothetical protein WC023_10490 [Rhodocyclaceae bacterium]